jgi:malonate-semialdehyde dehydrogenase (acetylating) / methylmalonate-semialdehyde dehydrogenase
MLICVTATETTAKTVPALVNGQWLEHSGARHAVYNPATGREIASLPWATVADVDGAVKAAQAAFKAWRETPVVDRVQPLYRFKALMEKHAEEVAATLTSENGKTIEDARVEVRRAIQMVEVACGMPSLMMGDSLNDVARGIDSRTVREPLGVCVGITPFNFPAMVPMWMIPFAIAAGNTFILKPSEKVPLTPTRCGELLLEAGIPEGVFQLIHGGKETVDALLHHPLVKAVSFVGSTPIAKYIYTTSAAQGKRVQALGGAKNHLVVMPDADMPRTVEAIISSAFGAAGERCLAGSVLVPVGDAAGPLLELLTEQTREITVGDGSKEGMGMGPVVTSDHRGKILGYIEKGVEEGAKIVCDGRQRAKEGSGYFVGPTIFDNVKPSMTIARDEIFGPVLSVIRADTFDDAVQLINNSEFGNTTSIFTQSGRIAREFQSRVEVGMIGVNIGVAAPMAFFPFAGWKNSFFGDLHAHGKDAVYFYTEQKVLMTRWF